MISISTEYTYGFVRDTKDKSRRTTSAYDQLAKGYSLINTWLDISRMDKGQTQVENRVHTHYL